MSAAGQGAAAGVVMGICAVLLAQQLTWITLSDLLPAIEYIVVAAVVGGVIFGLIGWALGRHYLARHPVITPPPSS